MDNYDSDKEYVKQLAEPLFGRTKRIRIWINGDTSNTSYEVSINPNVLRTWNTILIYITSVIQPRFGAIRRLLCLGSKLFINCFEDLCPCEKYVALGVTGRFKNLKNGYKSQSEIDIFERIKQSRKQFYCGEVVKQKVNFLRKTQKRGLTIIYVMVNGKNDQNPTKLVLSPLDIEAWSVTLHFLANALDIPEGIQHICTLFGNIVEDPHSLQHGFVYIAVPSNDKFVNMDYMGLFQNWKSSFVMKIRPSCSRIAFGYHFKGNKMYKAKCSSKSENKHGTNDVHTCVQGCTNIEDMDHRSNSQNRRTVELSVSEKCIVCRSNLSGEPQKSPSISTQSQKVLEGQVTAIGSKQYVISNKPCDKCEQIVDSDGKSSYLHYVGTRVCKTDGCCLIIVDPKTIRKKTPTTDKRSLGSKNIRMSKFCRGCRAKKRRTNRCDMTISCYNANNQCTQTLSFPFCKHVGCQQQLSNKESKNTYTEDDVEKNLKMVDEMVQPMNDLVEQIEKSTSNSSKVKDLSIFSSHSGVCNKCNPPISTDKKTCMKNTLASCQSAACSPNNSCYSTNRSVTSKHSTKEVSKEQSSTDCSSENHSLVSETTKPSNISKGGSVTPKQSISSRKQSEMSRASVRSASQKQSIHDTVSVKSGREDRESQKQIMENLPESTGVNEISSEPNLDCAMKCLDGIYVRNETNIEIYGIKNGKSYKFSRSKCFYGDLKRSGSDISRENLADEKNESRNASGCHCRCCDSPGRSNIRYAKSRQKSQDQTKAKDIYVEDDIIVGKDTTSTNSEKGKQNNSFDPQDQDNLRNYNNLNNDRKNTLREKNRQSNQTPDQDNSIKYTNFKNERKNTINEKNRQSSISQTPDQDNRSNYINVKNERKSSVRENDRRSSRRRTLDQDNVSNNNLENGRKNTVWNDNKLSINSSSQKTDNSYRPSDRKSFKEIENSKRAQSEKNGNRKESEVQQKFDDLNPVNNSKTEKMFDTDRTPPNSVDLSLDEKKMENEKKVSYIKNPPKNIKQSGSDEELLETISLDSIDSVVKTE